MIEHSCFHCGRNNESNWDSYGFCKYDNIESLHKQAHHEPCPFWVPAIKKDKIFRLEVERKVLQNKS